MQRVILSMVAIAFLACTGLTLQPAAKVRLDAAVMEPVANWRDVTGHIRPLRRSELATQEAGVVVEVSFDEGDRVEVGQVLVRLDDERASLELDQAHSVVASRQAMVIERTADVDDANRDLQRMEESAQSGSATQTEVDDAESDVTRAEARLAEANAELASARTQVRLAERRLADMTIEAPFDGVIVTKAVEIGQWLAIGDATLELLAMDQVEVWLDVPSQYLTMLEDGDGRVRVRVDAIGLETESSIAGVVPEVELLSRMAPVRMVLPNPEGRIKPGMAVVGLVPTGSQETMMTVHKDAILRDDAGEFVYFNAGGTAAPARIERLFAVGSNRVAIRAGALPPGAMLVVEGNERLFPGQPLTVLEGPEG